MRATEDRHECPAALGRSRRREALGERSYTPQTHPAVKHTHMIMYQVLKFYSVSRWNYECWIMDDKM
jgi:hypothetical protein